MTPDYPSHLKESKMSTQESALYSEKDKATSIATKCNSLEKLKEAVKSFSGCPLSRTATNMVFADGNPNAKLMIVGEAPGEEEDKTGIPFVGAAGKLLDKMLEAIEYDRKNTYITNVVFWRPPGNRKPNNEEIDICLPFLLKHVSLIKPKVLVLAGAIAAQALLNSKEGITQLRGKWEEVILEDCKEPIKTIAIFHPAFLLRQPARKREAWVDLKNIASTLKLIN